MECTEYRCISRNGDRKEVQREGVEAELVLSEGEARGVGVFSQGQNDAGLVRKSCGMYAVDLRDDKRVATGG